MQLARNIYLGFRINAQQRRGKMRENSWSGVSAYDRSQTTRSFSKRGRISASGYLSSNDFIDTIIIGIGLRLR